jgi:hypothetical protein
VAASHQTNGDWLILSAHEHIPSFSAKYSQQFESEFFEMDEHPQNIDFCFKSLRYDLLTIQYSIGHPFLQY